MAKRSGRRKKTARIAVMRSGPPKGRGGVAAAGRVAIVKGNQGKGQGKPGG